jgi:hypothetical protein
MKTIKDTVIEFILKGSIIPILNINIPKGSNVAPIKCGGGKIHYALGDICIIYQQFPNQSSILNHHFKYQNIYVPDEVVEI